MNLSSQNEESKPIPCLPKDDKRIIRCDICDKTFVKNWNLDGHMNTHQEKSHKCEFCEVEFGSMKEMKSHVDSVHNSIRDSKCESCDKTFTEKGNLARHIKIAAKRHFSLTDISPCDISPCDVSP